MKLCDNPRSHPYLYTDSSTLTTVISLLLSIMYKVDNNSICSSCKQKASTNHSLQCSQCEHLYHVVCTAAACKDDQICTTTFLSNFLSTSNKKPNFTWSCDVCRTEEESSNVATLRQLINKMEKSQEEKIGALTDLVKSLAEKVDALSEAKEEDKAPVTVWPSVNVNKIKSSFIVKRAEDGRNVKPSEVRKIATDAGIPVDSVIEAASGDMFVNLPDEESRDAISQLIGQSHESNPVVKLAAKLPTISVMGVTNTDMKDQNDQLLSADAIKTDIYKQNESIAVLVDKGSKLEVVYTRAPPAGKQFYTVAVRVAPDIRDLLKKTKMKIHLGASVHNVRDRFHVRRCNHCQGLGHYAAKCPQGTPMACGFCTKAHKSDDCPDKKKDHIHHKCINCSKNEHNEVGHSAFWNNCPSYVQAQEKMAKTISYDYESSN